MVLAPEAGRAALLQEGFRRDLSVGQHLFRAGDSLGLGWFLEQGEVRLVLPFPGGRELTAAVVQAGGWVLDPALLTDGPHRMNAQATRPSCVLALPGPALAEALCGCSPSNSPGSS